jgi:hypothetical protein
MEKNKNIFSGISAEAEHLSVVGILNIVDFGCVKMCDTISSNETRNILFQTLYQAISNEKCEISPHMTPWRAFFCQLLSVQALSVLTLDIDVSLTCALNFKDISFTR